MQIRGKIFTIAGIILLFGYFIKDSLKDPYDPTQIVMVGNDTLGRDWGAIAEQAIMNKQQAQAQIEREEAGYDKGYGSDSASSISSSEDPYNKPKFNQNNYATIQSTDGREVIVGYARPEDDPGEQDENGNTQSRIQTRHQKERPQLQQTEEPSMIYRE